MIDLTIKMKWTQDQNRKSKNIIFLNLHWEAFSSLDILKINK